MVTVIAADISHSKRLHLSSVVIVLSLIITFVFLIIIAHYLHKYDQFKSLTILIESSLWQNIFASLLIVSIITIFSQVGLALVTYYTRSWVTGYISGRKIWKYLRSLMTLMMRVQLLDCLVLLTMCIIYVYVSTPKERFFTKKMHKTFSEYMQDIDLKHNIDELQLNSKCCGVEKHTDWFDIDWKEYQPSVPFSCCRENYLGPCLNQRMNRSEIKALHSINLRGCVNALVEIHEKILSTSVCTLFLILILTFFNFCCFRYFQTSLHNSIKQNGDPKLESVGYVFAFRRSSKPQKIKHKKPIVTEEKSKKLEPVTPIKKPTTATTTSTTASNVTTTTSPSTNNPTNTTANNGNESEDETELQFVKIDNGSSNENDSESRSSIGSLVKKCFIPSSSYKTEDKSEQKKKTHQDRYFILKEIR